MDVFPSVGTLTIASMNPSQKSDNLSKPKDIANMDERWSTSLWRRHPSLPPPPYQPQQRGPITSRPTPDNHEPAFYEMIEALIDRSRPSVGLSSQAGANRLRNFLTFTLVMDYKSKFGPVLGLSTTDMEHFTTLASILRLYTEANCGSSSSLAEITATEPYLCRYLFDPCKTLGVQTAAVYLAIQRFFTYTNFRNVGDPGSQMSMLFEDSPETLATKLYVDRTIMIPRLIRSTQLMRELLDGLNNVSSCFYTKQVELEISNLPQEPWYIVSQSYDLNLKGKVDKRFNEQIKDFNHAGISPRHWLARFKFFIGKRQARTSTPA